MAGASAPLETYRKHSTQVVLPWSVVTTTSFAPGLVATGVLPVMRVGLTTVRSLSSAAPIVTLLALVKEVPVIVTLVPPAGRPVAGLTLVIVTGAGVVIDSLQPAWGSAARMLTAIAEVAGHRWPISGSVLREKLRLCGALGIAADPQTAPLPRITVQYAPD